MKLNELVTGDYVAYTDRCFSVGVRGSYPIWKKLRVTRDTPTRLTVNGMQFNRRTGIKIGNRSDWNPTRIVPWPDEVKREAKETARLITEEIRRYAVINRGK